jgi:L-fuculose-phosphate aldolase
MTIRKDILEVSKLLYAKNLVNAFEGNVSVIEDSKVYITPSAVCKGFLSEDMLVVMDLDGNILEGKCKPSSEAKLHLASYRDRPDIKAVVHAHPPYATAFAVANRPIETKAYPEMIVLFDKVPLAAYGTPSTDEIYHGMQQYVKEYDIILLANHGLVAYGRDVFDAFFKLESIEGIAKVLTLAGQLGGAKDLPQNKLEELYELRKKSRVPGTK